MPEDYIEKEYEEVKKRRPGGIIQVIKNVKTWQFIFVLGLIGIFFWMLKESTDDKRQLFIIALAVLAFVFFFQKKAEAGGLISEEVAKKIAIETIESKKEEFHISGDTDVSPTNYCVLQYRMGDPLKWHVGVKIENRDGGIKYWRVMIHPYDGIVIGIANAPTGFEGTEEEVRDVVVVFPEHYMMEGK